MFVPIIKPTLKNANFEPNNFVKANETVISKTNIINEKRTLLFINFDLHNKSQINQEKIRDPKEIKIAFNGDISKTLLSTIKTPEL